MKDLTDTHMVDKNAAPSLIGPFLLVDTFHGDQEVALEVKQSIDIEEQPMDSILAHQILRSKLGGEVLNERSISTLVEVGIGKHSAPA